MRSAFFSSTVCVVFVFCIYLFFSVSVQFSFTRSRSRCQLVATRYICCSRSCCCCCCLMYLDGLVCILNTLKLFCKPKIFLVSSNTSKMAQQSVSLRVSISLFRSRSLPQIHRSVAVAQFQLVRLASCLTTGQGVSQTD